MSRANLSAESRKNVNQMLFNIAKTWGVDGVTDIYSAQFALSKQFSATPTIAQELVDAIVLSDEFLNKINFYPVDELSGEKVLGGVNGSPPGRTDTTGAGVRSTTEIASFGSRIYTLLQSDYDYHLRYSTLDQWAKFKDLGDRYGRWLRRNMALGRLMVGWHGISAAATTNPVANPLGEDVNKGWFQLLREYNGGAQVLDQGQTPNVIQLGAGGDYENLDSLVLDTKALLHTVHQGSRDLVVIIGDELMMAEKAQIYAAHGQTPSEKVRRKIQEITSEFAGLPLEPAPSHFPSRGVMVTSLDNLSIYYQNTSMRRTIKDRPEKNRMEEFNSVNEGYVIEDEEKAAVVEFANVRIPTPAGGWG